LLSARPRRSTGLTGRLAEGPSTKLARMNNRRYHVNLREFVHDPFPGLSPPLRTTRCRLLYPEFAVFFIAAFLIGAILVWRRFGARRLASAGAR
jgi:hypothetical protein